MRRFVLTIVVVLLSSLAPVASARPAPSVVRVDPPNWWTHFSEPDLQIVIQGENLAGASLVSDSASVSVERQQVNAEGTYLLAHALVADNATPGPIALRLVTGDSTVIVPFELRERPSTANRFAGLTPDDVVYLIMPDRFADGDPSNDETVAPGATYDRKNPQFYHGGDLRGIIDHLSYLKDLGITAIWLNPIYDNVDKRQSFQPYHGYSAVDYYTVENHFGTLADVQELVDRAHALGIKIVQDEVVNHTGGDHLWLATYPTPAWYNGTPSDHLTNPFDIGSIVNPNGNTNARRATLEGWFGGFLPDLNQNDPETAQYEIQNTLWWIESTGFDGIRQDTFPYVPRTFWNRWMTAIKGEFPSFTVIGEVFDGNVLDTSFFQGGSPRYDGVDSKLDTVFDYPLYFQIVQVFASGADTSALKGILDADPLYDNPSILVPFIGNHDTARFITVSHGVAKRLMLAQAFVLTTRGIPQLYYGDEIGIDGGNDPDNRHDFVGGFPGDAHDGFTAAGRSKKQNKIFNFVQRLLAIRAEHAALRGGSTTFVAASGATLAYVRERDGERALVVFNTGTTKRKISLDVGSEFAEGATLTDAVAGRTSATVSGGHISIKLGGLGVAVLLPE